MWVAIGFTIAAAIGMYLLQGEWYFAASGCAALILAAVILLMQRFPRMKFLAFCIFGCVIGFIWLSVFEVAYLSVPRAADEKRVVLTITATDYSSRSDYGYVVDGVGYINNRPYRMRMYLPNEVDIAPGDTLTARYLIRSTLPGGSAEAVYHASDGMFLTAKAFRTPDLVKTEKLPWYGYPALIRQTIREVVHQIFPEDTEGLAVALLIGDTDGLDYMTDTSFKTSGISHFVAVSGFHVTALFAIVYVLLGRKRLLAVLIGIPLLLLFAAVTGFSQSTVRAVLMHSLMIIATLFDREYDPLTALGFAALVMLILNPWTVTNVGFQLSAGCMIGILLLSDPIKEWIIGHKYFSKLKGKRKKVLTGFAVSVGMSLGATIAVTPLCAYYFGIVSLVSVLTNLLTSWVIALIFYGVILAFLSALFYMPLGSILGWVIAWPIRYVILVAKGISKFPLAAVYMDSDYMVIWLVFVYVLLLVYMLAKRKPLLECICCAVISLCVALLLSWVPPKLDECRVTVLDVGQGQCILLQSHGKSFLVDCGGDSDEESANIAAKALFSQGVYVLDGVIFTHYDRDHAAGAAYLLQRIPAKALYMPNCLDADGTAALLTAVHDGSIISVEQDISVQFEDTQISLIPSQRNLSDNESGLCVLFQTQNCDILITGDRSAMGERELMRDIDLPELEVLIVGHHGSKYSTSEELLEKTKPEYAIISAGADNSYGHPTAEVIQRLLDAGSIIYRTDLHGTIIFRR